MTRRDSGLGEAMAFVARRPLGRQALRDGNETGDEMLEHVDPRDEGEVVEIIGRRRAAASRAVRLERGFLQRRGQLRNDGAAAVGGKEGGSLVRPGSAGKAGDAHPVRAAAPAQSYRNVVAARVAASMSVGDAVIHRQSGAEGVVTGVEPGALFLTVRGHGRVVLGADMHRWRIAG